MGRASNRSAFFYGDEGIVRAGALAMRLIERGWVLDLAEQVCLLE